MMAVSPGDRDHSEVISRSEDRRPGCGLAVRKTEDAIPNAQEPRGCERSENRGW